MFAKWWVSGGCLVGVVLGKSLGVNCRSLGLPVLPFSCPRVSFFVVVDTFMGKGGLHGFVMIGFVLVVNDWFVVIKMMFRFFVGSRFVISSVRIPYKYTQK